MKGPRELLEHEDRWVTRMGKWFPGERTVFRGRDLHRELGGLDSMALHVFAVSGRRLSEAELALLNAIWVNTNYPDPRLWNNRAVAHAGAARSTGSLALSAGLAVSEATVYGRRPDIRAIDFLRRTRTAIEGGALLSEVVDRELKRHRALPGFGRPIVRADERIPHLIRRARDLGLADGPHVGVAYKVEVHLRATRQRLSMNYAAITAALCADLGFTSREYYLLAFPVFLSGMIPCWIETQEHSEGAFLPLSCGRIRYAGPDRRSWCDAP